MMDETGMRLVDFYFCVLFASVAESNVWVLQEG